MTTHSFMRQTGFTLVEVLTVMLVLVAMASVTLEFSKDLAFQSRYEVTKDRYEKIRRAIVGRPDVLINGQPDISGFVADMGRLPDNLRELLQSGYCVTTGGSAPSDLTTEWRPSTCSGDWQWSVTPCSDSTSVDATSCVGGHRWSGQKTGSNLTVGWHGPYIDTTKSFDDVTALVDGWGNTNDNLNYGWNFANLSDPDVDLRLNSLGKDGDPDGTDYDQDYPDKDFISITNNDWLVNIDGIQANILASGITGSCSSVPFDTDFYACELAGGDWDGSCSATSYTSRYPCELNGETWTADNSCSGFPTNPNNKLACESLGGTWDGSASDICMKVYFPSIDSVSGEIKTNEPLVSTGKSITEDGLTHLITFDGFFHDLNDNGLKDVVESDFSVVPIGMAAIAIHDYNSGASTCKSTKYRSAVPIKITIFNASLLPVIHW